MNPLQTITILFLGFSILCCNQNQTKQINKVDTGSQKVEKPNRASQKPKKTLNLTAKLPELFVKALAADTIEFTNRDPFLYFKSGHFLSNTEKNAITIKCPDDAKSLVKMYKCQGAKWQLTDSITGLDGFTVDFDVIYADFNFDHQLDIYIQASISNGYPLSRGHLIIMRHRTTARPY